MKTSIVRTRYRDITWEEAKQCQPTAVDKTWRSRWESLRGEPVVIETPALEHGGAAICGGPFFKVMNGAPKQCVCPHIAEIGD